LKKKNIHSNIEGKMVVNEKSYKNTPNDEKMIRIVVAIVIIPGTAVLRMYKKTRALQSRLSSQSHPYALYSLDY